MIQRELSIRDKCVASVTGKDRSINTRRPEAFCAH